jgi:hypothetical protein
MGGIKATKVINIVAKYPPLVFAAIHVQMPIQQSDPIRKIRTGHIIVAPVIPPAAPGC